MGIRIAPIALAGQRQVSREEILATAGVTGASSLLFLDVADTRARLKSIPGSPKRPCSSSIPDRLQITVTEREAFALWQPRARSR